MHELIEFQRQRIISLMEKVKEQQTEIEDLVSHVETLLKP
jgi:cell division protein FtsL